MLPGNIHLGDLAVLAEVVVQGALVGLEADVAAEYLATVDGALGNGGGPAAIGRACHMIDAAAT